MKRLRSLDGLGERQAMVLRALVSAYTAEAAPVASQMISHLLPVPLSSASIRATLAELMEAGLLEQPHSSSGRVPTESGLRLFVDRFVEPRPPAAYARRSLVRSFEEAGLQGAIYHASDQLSRTTRQLGFVLQPRLEAVVLQHVSFIGLSSERVLVVLVSRAGQTHRRVLECAGATKQAELDRMASLLNDRVAGRTLPAVRRLLEADLAGLRSHAGDLVARALALGLQALDPGAAGIDDPGELVIATRLALLDQPEFNDPHRLRALYEAIETRELLVDLVSSVLATDGVSVTLGEDLETSGLRRCALVAAPYGGGATASGVLGVIGPSRMDYGQVMGLVDLCSCLLTDALAASATAEDSDGNAGTGGGAAQ